MRQLQPLFDSWSRWTRHRRPRGTNASGVLLISSGGLGDTILLSHVLDRFIAVAQSGENVTVILRTDAAKTAFLFPKDVAVETVDFGRLRKDRSYRHQIAQNIYDQNYRLAISLDYLRHPYLDEFLLHAADAVETIAMIAKPWPKYANALAKSHAAMTRTFDSGPPVKDKLIRWTDFANWLTSDDMPPPLARRDTYHLPPPATLDRPTVYIQAFSAVREKQPNVDVFTTILKALLSDWNICFTGAPGEDARNPDYKALFDDPRVTYDDSTFEALLPKLRAARLVISVDTAFLHLAIAVGAPTLGLASAAYVGEIVPYASECTPANAKFMYHDMPCRSCLGDCILPKENGRYPCIARLPQEDVVRAVTDLIDAGV